MTAVQTCVWRQMASSRGNRTHASPTFPMPALYLGRGPGQGDSPPPASRQRSPLHTRPSRDARLTGSGSVASRASQTRCGTRCIRCLLRCPCRRKARSSGSSCRLRARARRAAVTPRHAPSKLGATSVLVAAYAPIPRCSAPRARKRTREKSAPASVPYETLRSVFSMHLSQVSATCAPDRHSIARSVSRARAPCGVAHRPSPRLPRRTFNSDGILRDDDGRGLLGLPDGPISSDNRTELPCATPLPTSVRAAATCSIAPTGAGSRRRRSARSSCGPLTSRPSSRAETSARPRPCLARGQRPSAQALGWARDAFASSF